MAAVRPLHPHRSHPAGFTLIELLIVVAMIGALLAVTIPNIGRQVNRDRVQRSAMVVQGMLDEASALAARRRSPVTVTLAGSELRIRDRATGNVIRSRAFGPNEDLRATLVMVPNTGITIFPNGRSNANVTITLTGSGGNSTITRTTTGIVRRQ